MSLPLIQINGKCEVPFCLGVSAKNVTLFVLKKNNEKKITQFMLIYVKIIKKIKIFFFN